MAEPEPGYFDNDNIARKLLIEYGLCPLVQTRYEHKLQNDGTVIMGLRNVDALMNVLVEFDPNKVGRFDMIAGGIIMWSGAVIDIPADYALCDGTHGTPDLRNKFIRGAGDAYNPDDEGGAATHEHDFTGDGHYHIVPAGTSIAAGADYRYYTQQSVATGTTDPKDTIPPFYALCYIMKL